MCVYCVLYGYQNKQRSFPYTALTDWFYNLDGVFTVWHEFNPRVELRLVPYFKGAVANCTITEPFTYTDSSISEFIYVT